jgi:hypothetical protein
MSKTAWYRVGRSLIVAGAVTVLAGCTGEGSLGPDGRAATGAQLAASEVSLVPDLGTCGHLKVDAGHEFALRLFARGVQIYHWNGSGWSFDGPSADLYADAAFTSKIGTHYSGPTWESLPGSLVVGSILQRCTPDPNSIQWLLLGAVRSKGPGVFKGITFIQRLNTVGGIAPAGPGSSIGEEARVPYTTEYLFYRPE